MSNRLKAINSLARGIKLVEVFIDITATDGEFKRMELKVAVNKLNKLSGNGLTSKALYELKKTGTATSTDIHGNKFVYTLGKQLMSTELLPVISSATETESANKTTGA